MSPSPQYFGTIAWPDCGVTYWLGGVVFKEPKKIAGTDHHYMGRDYAEYENINCEWCGEVCLLPLIRSQQISLCLL